MGDAGSAALVAHTVAASISGDAAQPGIAVAVRKVTLGRRIQWDATIAGDTFRVGREVGYSGGLRGLMSVAGDSYGKYDPADWREEYGVWADMVGVTATVESGCEHGAINTYDTARFTFGMMQWGAHTEDANLVMLLRKLLALPNAASYFPDLCVHNGRVARRQGTSVDVLETANSTAGLQAYLNPDPRAVGEAEVAVAARLIHWVTRDPVGNKTTCQFALESYIAFLQKEVDKKVGLDGCTDVEVLLCMDIRHQGRGSYAKMTKALEDKSCSVNNLLEVGLPREGAEDTHGRRPRVLKLRQLIRDGISSGYLGRHRYSRASGGMVRNADAPTPEQDAGFMSRVARSMQAAVTATAKPAPVPVQDRTAAAAIESPPPAPAPAPIQTPDPAVILEPAAPATWAEAHCRPMRRTPVRRADSEPAAHRLDEPDMPRRVPNASVEDRVAALRRIALYLDAKNSLRYQRAPTATGSPGRTRCNIYAYDFATLAGVYLPRVWWKKAVLKQAGREGWPEPVYNQTVEELTANALHDWFETYSSNYGWRRASSVDELQTHANAGGIATIVAKHVNPARSGHIVIVAPEASCDADGAEWNAVRAGAVVKCPVQSQAGAINFAFGHGSHMPPAPWWTFKDYVAYGFWVHA